MIVPIRLRLVALLLVLTALIGTGMYWLELGDRHARLREDTLTDAAKRAENIAEAQADHIQALLLGADMTLRHYRDAFRRGDRAGVTEVVRTAFASFPAGSITHFSAVNSQGYIDYSSADAPLNLYVGDRDYVKFHFNNDQDELYINKPLIGRSNSRWLVLLSRPILATERPSGIAVMSLSPEYLSRAIASVGLKPTDVVTIFFADGAYLARSHLVEQVLGKSMTLDRPFMNPDAPKVGNFRAISAADKIPRLFAWHKLERYPLIINVGLDERPILAATEARIDQERQNAIVATCIVLTLAGLVALLLVYGDRQQHELAASRSLLQTIIDSTPFRIYWKDRDLRYLGCNPAFASDSGMAGPNELIGRDDSATAWHAESEGYRAEDLAIIQSGVPRLAYEEARIAPDGQVRWIRKSKVPLRDRNDRVIGLLGIYEDVTELRKADNRRKLLEYALDQVNEAAYLIDSRGGFQYVNDGAVRQLGHARADLLAMRIHDLDPSVTDAGWAAHWRELAERGSMTVETLHRHRDGQLVPMEIYANHVVFEGWEYNLALARDVTARREMQRKMEEARQAAENLARTKSQFLANMSHEIRTPLNAVLGLAKIVVRENWGRDNARIGQGILDAGQHLLGVINQILDFSKLEAGKMSAEQKPFRLDALVVGAGNFLREAAAEKGLRFRIDLAPDLPNWVSGDPQHLQQILLNLLSNAVKFTAAGEVSLEVAPGGQTIRFRIADTGIGIAAADRENIFHPFEQVDASDTRRYQGTGLGLAISRTLARLMGGDITVDSQPGVGSTFILDLPLGEAAPPADADEVTPAGGESAGRLDGLQILAAEDIAVNRLILDDMLSRAGATCVFAENGLEAVRRIEESPAGYDVVLMDVQMPDLDGYEATRRIGRLAPRLPVIGLTAHALEEERQQCLAAGMVDHVPKPIDAGRLVAAILRWTRREY